MGRNASSDGPLFKLLYFLSFLDKVGCSIWYVTLSKLLLVCGLTLETSNSRTDCAIGSSVGCWHRFLIVGELHLLSRARIELTGHGAEVFDLAFGGLSYLLCSHPLLGQRADICTALHI